MNITTEQHENLEKLIKFLNDEQLQSESMVVNEKLAGNLVKEEFWHGKLHTVKQCLMILNSE